MKKIISKLSLVALALTTTMTFAQVDKSDWEGGFPEGCTSITVGKLASFDGSVITSHTDDSHRTRSWMDVVPAKKHKKGAMSPMFKRVANNDFAMPTYEHKPIGGIPQVEHTFKFMNTAYPCINEHQLAMGESTFGGREELQSDAGLIDCQRLNQLMLERCTTARQAIQMAGELLKEYGWNDAGEALTIADKNEVWHLEIVGPGKGKVGAVWVAQRVPDDHISCNVNASTIKEINLEDKDHFMASENVFEVAKENGWWNPEDGEFRFCYAYAPESRTSLAARRREWRIFDLLAPSLKLDPYAENYPFSVKPDEKVTLEKLVTVFQDYYEDTPFDMTKDMLVKGEDGKAVKSPLANPNLPYEANKLHKINGGWGWRGERTIARWYTMYATIIQCRDWLPDNIGGVVWLAQDNAMTSVYVPFYCGIDDMPVSYKTPGRPNGYTQESAWWAFNRMSTLVSQRWGDARHDVEAVFGPMQKELFANQKNIEAEALELFKKNPKKGNAFLQEYSFKHANKAVKEAWKLGDLFWTKYDELF
ncbi:MAG: peptidase C69 [Bacteroidetes bacterium]|nr:peptidase C69 [Bacteroidota bacterium]